MKKLIFTMILYPISLLRRIQNMLIIYYLRSRGVEIGQNTYLSPKAYIDTHNGSKVKIGNNCYVTRNVVILNHTDTCRGGPQGIWLSKGGGRVLKDVIIGNNVFIGVNSVILPGVTIGDNAVIGALSMVNNSVPANTVWAGNPAKQLTTTSEMISKEFPKFTGL